MTKDENPPKSDVPIQATLVDDSARLLAEQVRRKVDEHHARRDEAERG